MAKSILNDCTTMNEVTKNYLQIDNNESFTDINENTYLLRATEQ